MEEKQKQKHKKMNDDERISLYDMKCHIIHKLELHLDENLKAGDNPFGGVFMEYIEEYKNIVKNHPVITLVRVAPDEGDSDTSNAVKIKVVKHAERWYQQEIGDCDAE